MFPFEGETIGCEYCGKTAVAGQDMEWGFQLSQIRAEEGAHLWYFCSIECLTAWAKEPLSFAMARSADQQRDREWREEEKEKKG